MYESLSAGPVDSKEAKDNVEVPIRNTTLLHRRRFPSTLMDEE
jgi:hypothetical protein